MQQLTFGEQVKILLSRKNMTIKELAEKIEVYTGKPMSRQNLTQRLHRDNFQEQDMRLIAEILECKFTLSIMEPLVAQESEPNIQGEVQPEEQMAREVTVGELIDMQDAPKQQRLVALRKGKVVKKKKEEETSVEEQTEENIGDINPYTGKEYATNSVRMHPHRIGYVQVYDREKHVWTDMTEWAFLGFQEQQKHQLGKDYVPPIYLD